jgi:hypothetical protein
VEYSGLAKCKICVVETTTHTKLILSDVCRTTSGDQELLNQHCISHRFFNWEVSPCIWNLRVSMSHLGTPCRWIDLQGPGSKPILKPILQPLQVPLCVSRVRSFVLRLLPQRKTLTHSSKKELWYLRLWPYFVLVNLVFCHEAHRPENSYRIDSKHYSRGYQSFNAEATFSR